MPEPANLDWPLFRTPHFLSALLKTLPPIFPGPSFRQQVGCFLNQTQCARNEVSRVADLFLVILVQFDLFICVIQQQFERGKTSGNRIWIAVEAEGFLLPAMALNQAADGGEIPVAAAFLAQAFQQCLRARQSLRKNCKVDLRADVPQLQGK